MNDGVRVTVTMASEGLVALDILGMTSERSVPFILKKKVSLITIMIIIQGKNQKEAIKR